MSMEKILRAAKVCLLIALAVGLWMIFRHTQELRAAERDYADAALIAGLPEERESNSTGTMVRPEAGGETHGEGTRPLPEVVLTLARLDFQALRDVNEDVLGWIQIPGTEVSYPLLQAEDNQYYLKRSWKGDVNSAGAIFMEYRSDPSLDGFHTIVYGHRMRNGTMFGSLKHYNRQAYWEEHPAVYIATERGVYEYEIFSAFAASVQGLVYDMDLEGSEEDFISYCLRNSELDTGISPEAGDRILTLSTCTGNGYASRWVVQARLAESYLWEVPEDQENVESLEDLEDQEISENQDTE